MEKDLNSIYKETRHKMEVSLNVLKNEIKGIRSGRAHPSLVEDLPIDYYGTKTPLKQLASITVPEARLIVIQPWDRNSLSAIEKAILASDLGITPSNDGKVIRLNLPQLSEEQRNNLIRVVNKKAEEIRIAIRNVRREAIHEIESLLKEKLISEDDKKRAEKEVQKITDEFISKVNKIVKEKEEEIKEV